jgi:hypothetical protein
MRRRHLPVPIPMLCALGLALALPPARAASTPGAPAPVAPAAPMDSIYLCVDGDGHKSYQSSAEGASCRRVDGVIESIPASDLGRRAHPTPTRPLITPASFPRVDVNTQRTRDSDRRHILQDELRIEQDHLARLRSEFNQGRPEPAVGELVGSSRYIEHVQRLYDDIERSEGNIASLQRELTPARY